MDGKKILAAEDDAFSMKMFTTILTSLGQSIDPAIDGKECFTKYQASHSTYKMIFMDLHMPNMDGYEVCFLIRNRLLLLIDSLLSNRLLKQSEILKKLKDFLQLRLLLCQHVTLIITHSHSIETTI